MLAVDQREEADLLALQEFLDHELRAGLAEARSPIMLSMAAVGLGERLGDDHALAGGEPVGLDDDRAARWPAT